MPAPASASFSVAALAAANGAFKDLVDAGSGPGVIKLFTEADVLVATIVLEDPCGTVNVGTGQLVLAIATQEDAAPAGGTVTYGRIEDSAGTLHLAIPVVQGGIPVAGYIVMNTVVVVEGSPVEILSATLG
jgi:hypothetical protein